MLLPLRSSALVVMVFAALAAGQEPRRPTDAFTADDYEEKAVQRAMGRHMRYEGEGKRWEKEIARAFPDRFKVGDAENDFGKWFEILAGESRDWRRDAAPTKAVADLFDNMTQRMDLGPVPSIRKEEFLRFAQGNLQTPPKRAMKPEDTAMDADRAFRILDRDGSGELEMNEWSERIRSELKKFDANGNRMLNIEEYRGYFGERVTDSVEKAMTVWSKVESAMQPLKSGKLPAWFQTLDTDEDGQIGLYEWRAGNRSIEEYLAMDLDMDGLLPPSEYMRYVAMVAQKERPSTAVRKPAPPPTPATRPEIGKKSPPRK